MRHSRLFEDDEVMNPSGRTSIFVRTLACWNWKCALLSATARSLVYLAAMARTGLRGGLAIVLVEIAYVTLTAGLYAGMQQRALGLRSRLLGNMTVALGVPALAQTLDWLAHRAVGPSAPGRATLAVCIFTAVSALFHLHVMRRGAFLTGRAGRTLADDFRRMPRLIAGFVLQPFAIASPFAARMARAAESEAAL
jgi:hypothetical protein